jgi:amino acid adenylation domain-containing protein
VRLQVAGDRLRINAPKGVLSATLRAQLADRKQELIDFLRANHDGIYIPPPIARRDGNTPAPLSFAQERIWFLEQLEPGGAVFNICRASRLLGDLVIAALEASLNEVMRRHEALRSVIRVVDGRPQQVAIPELGLKLNVIDLQNYSVTEGEAQLQAFIREQSSRPFNFAVGGFLRSQLLRLTNEEHVLILTMHHIMSDAWSMGNLTREIWLFYDAFVNAKANPLVELPIQYSDFAFWQRNWLRGDVLDGQLAYWKKQLAGAPSLDLPTDRPRPSRQSFRGGRVQISLPQSLTESVNELSYRFNITPFMTLLASFCVVLCRYSGQEDIAVGTPIANRRKSEFEPLIGLFVNTLVLRTSLSGTSTVKELLLRVRDVCLGAYVREEVPFEKLVEGLNVDRDLTRNPLFQTMFTLQNSPKQISKPSNIVISEIEVDSETSPFDLALYLRERTGELVGFFEYSTDLFDRETIERMAGHFKTVLEGTIADPEQPISTLRLLTQAERHQILVEWNNTETEYPKDVCIHELFEAQAARTPESIALEFDGKQLTYRQLDCRANELAHYLRGLGVGPEKLVGICVERSLEMIVGLLGILKAGAAYVPLDPSYPIERLRFMLEDAQVSVLVTQEGLIKNGGWRIEDGNPRSSILDSRFMIVCLDRDWPTISQQRDDNPKTGVGSENLAYVIYTSGSTGQPKGVQVAHRSVVNCLCSVGDQIGLSTQDTWLTVTTISFDIAVLEIFLPLITGVKVVLASRTESLDGTELSKRLRSCGATVMQATPTSWNILLDAGWEGSPEFKILCGGEVLSRRLAERLTQSGAPVWNLYGPTETTIWSTMYRVEPGAAPVYIGRPVANTQIYILDAYMQPVPIGVHGDLYIGGAGLARGYMNREELTAERFIHNPFSDDPESRLYRTGDRARRRPDGNIEFVGRSDNQVKIRGHRIELREIEAILSQHPSIKEIVVVAVNNESFDSEDPKSKTRAEHGRSIDHPKSLVAYVASPGNEPSVAELRTYLEEKLPDYMIPSFVVPLNALPRTANGKVDRNALPPPDGIRPELVKGLVEPRSELEGLVAKVWREVLKLDKIGIHDNFFDLGGHSLLATQIVAKLRGDLCQEVPVRLLFEAPTVAKLSARIEGVRKAGFPNSLSAIVKLPRPERIPLSVTQEKLWRIEQLVPGTHFFNMPYVYRLSGDLNIGVLEKSIGDIVRRHESLRTVFGHMDGRPYQIINPACEFQLRVIDLRKLNANRSSDKAARLILEEKRKPFHLEMGPLFRTVLLRLTDTESFLLITFHHIIADFWSVQVFRSQLNLIYEAFSQGLTPSLPESRIQSADYAIWERRQLEDHCFDQQLDYWREQLAPPLRKLSLAKSRQRMKGVLFQTNRITFELDEGSLATMKAAARQENVTPFIIVLAVLTIALHEWSQETDIRVGVLLANREQSVSQDVIGHFVNTVVVRNLVNPQMTFRGFLKQVQAGFHSASSNQELPFSHLVRVLRNENKFERSNLFQVLLSYQSPSFATNDWSGITFAPLGWRPRRTSSEAMLTACDIAFNLREMETKLTGTVIVRASVFEKGLVNGKIRGLMKLIPYVAENLSENILSGRAVLK